MKITFTEEEKLVGQGVRTVVENAPAAAVKVGVGIIGAGASIGWGLTKAVFGAGKVLVNSASAAVDAYQQAANAQKTQQSKVIDAEVVG